MSEPKLIHKKIATIQKEVGAIPKNGRGPANKGSFEFIKAEDVLNKIHELLVREEVIVVPTITHSKHEVVREKDRGYLYATVSVQYEYIAVEDGSSIVTSSVGEGSDIGSDTATRKAATQALKISHLHMFTIPTSELDDGGDYGVNPSTGEVKEPKQNRAVATAAKEHAAPTQNITKLRAEVKKEGERLGLNGTEINAEGVKIEEDFFNNVASLSKLLDILKERKE